MTEIIQLDKYQEYINNIKELIDIFNTNFKNTTFHQMKDETDERAFKRGQGILDEHNENIKNLRRIIGKKELMKELFVNCQENEKRIMEESNRLINEMMMIKKRKATKEEYQRTKAEMNRMRSELQLETPEMKNRREVEEMLEEIKEEKE